MKARGGLVVRRCLRMLLLKQLPTLHYEILVLLCANRASLGMWLRRHRVRWNAHARLFAIAIVVWIIIELIINVVYVDRVRLLRVVRKRCGRRINCEVVWTSLSMVRIAHIIEVAVYVSGNQDFGRRRLRIIGHIRDIFVTKLRHHFVVHVFLIKIQMP